MNSRIGSCLKVLVILFNLMFLILGLLLIIFGALVYSQTVKYSEVTSLSGAPAAFLMTLGGLVCVISFLGSCGAFMESYCLLMSFSIIVASIVAAEAVSVGLVYSYRYSLEDAVVHGMDDLIREYQSTKESKEIIDELQSQMHCCGGSNVTDWLYWYPNEPFPSSCCSVDLNVTDNCTSTSPFLFSMSCRDAIEYHASSNITSLISVVAVFLVVQVISLFASCSMARSTRKDYYRFV